jgi:hypothetical protein
MSSPSSESKSDPHPLSITSQLEETKQRMRDADNPVTITWYEDNKRYFKKPEAGFMDCVCVMKGFAAKSTLKDHVQKKHDQLRDGVMEDKPKKKPAARKVIKKKKVTGWVWLPKPPRRNQQSYQMF